MADQSLQIFNRRITLKPGARQPIIHAFRTVSQQSQLFASAMGGCNRLSHVSILASLLTACSRSNCSISVKGAYWPDVWLVIGHLTANLMIASSKGATRLHPF